MVNAAALNRVVAAKLYGVKAVEPAIYAVGACVLLVALLLAAVLPALRSLRIHPREAMRAE